MPVAVQADEQATLPNNSVSARPQTGDNQDKEDRTALVGRQKSNATTKYARTPDIYSSRNTLS